MQNILRGVPIFKQQGYELCWAACLEMVFNYFFPPAPKGSQHDSQGEQHDSQGEQLDLKGSQAALMGSQAVSRESQSTALGHIGQFDIVAGQYGLSHSSEVVDAETGKIKPIYNKAVIVDEIIKIGYAFGYHIERVVDVETYWAILKSEIMENRPLIANIGFHYVVVVGFSENTEGGYFFYNDPKKDFVCKKKFKKDDRVQIDDDLLIFSPPPQRGATNN